MERKRKKKEEKTPDKYHKFDFLALEMHKPRIMVHWVDDIFHVEASNLANYMKLGILVHFDMLFPSRGGTRLKNEKCCRKLPHIAATLMKFCD